MGEYRPHFGGKSDPSPNSIPGDGHGLQKSKFVFSEAELALCMTGVVVTGPSCFYCAGSRGYVGIYYGPWYLVSEHVLDHPRLWG